MNSIAGSLFLSLRVWDQDMTNCLEEFIFRLQKDEIKWLFEFDSLIILKRFNYVILNFTMQRIFKHGSFHKRCNSVTIIWTTHLFIFFNFLHVSFPCWRFAFFLLKKNKQGLKSWKKTMFIYAGMVLTLLFKQHCSSQGEVE